MKYLAVCVFPFLAALVACGTEGFDKQSNINTLRVLAVRADNPYPLPGDTVDLEMLWHDGKAPVDEPRPVQILWLGSCFNPLGDYFNRCYPQLAEKLADVREDPSLAPHLFGFGDSFQMTIPEDLISRRPTVQGLEPYGLTFVFFAVCAGRIGPANPEKQGMPFGCFDEAGKQLGSEDFVPGYLGLYSFEHRTNTNPVLNGFLIDEKPVDQNDLPVFSRCTKQSCAKLRLRVLVDPNSVELASGFVDAHGKTITEQMWVEYLSTGGTIASGPRLVNDGTHGFSEDNGTDYTPPSVAGKQYLFAVVRDSRGGTAWIKQGVMFE